MKIITKIVFLICLSVVIRAQTGTLLFDDSYIHTIYLQCNIPNWYDTLLNDYKLNAAQPEVYAEKYRVASIAIDGVLYDTIGFRNKGNSSNQFLAVGRKRPLKIAFDEFKNYKHDGLKKINLNNFVNDPSLLHEHIAYKLMRQAGIIAPRTAFAKVFVNNNYIGVYLMVENVDKTFLKQNFGSANNEGNLFKTDRNAKVTLAYLGDDKQAYKKQGLKITTNEATDDYTGLIQFIKKLNTTQVENFKDTLEKIFDVHTFLKVLAVEKAIRSWDTYTGGGNNFYLYQHPSGQFKWIPWDVNESFQDLKLLSKTKLIDGYLIPTNKFKERTLLNVIFSFDEFKKEYLEYVCYLKTNLFTINNLGKDIFEKHNLLIEPYREDENKFNEFESFMVSLEQEHIDKVSFSNSGYALQMHYPGIFSLIKQQQKWLDEQLQGWAYSCPVHPYKYPLHLYPNPCANKITISGDANLLQLSHIEVYTMQGQKLIQTPLMLANDKDFTIETNLLPAGVYVIRKLDANGNVGYGKFIKLDE